MPTTTHQRTPLRLAHRGDWRVAPENSLAALAAAMLIPACDGVEFDVQLARDGTPVVIHDDTLARVQHHDARVDALDADELAAFGVPTLASVMAALPGAWLDVELKGPGHGEATAAVLRSARGDHPDDAVVSSFDAPSLVAMAALLPGWPRWLNVEADAPGALAHAIVMGCAGVSVDWRLITPALVRTANEAGLEVAAWTVRRRATVRRLGRLGVRATCVEAAALDGDPVGHPARGQIADGEASGVRAPDAPAGAAGDRLVLAAEGVRVEVSPADGGRLASVVVDGHELLVTSSPDGAIYWGAYPMAPWAGRIRHGRFAFRGQEHQLPITMPPHAIHGVAYDRPWTVTGPDEITLDLDARWPFRGRLVQRFTVERDGLEVCMRLEAAEPMPAVLGWHPWFRRVLTDGAPPVDLAFRPSAMLLRDGEGIPTGELVVPTPDPWDDCFPAPEADPVLTWPGLLRLTLSSSCPWWVVYTQPAHAVCVEPQSGPPDGVTIAPEVVEPGRPLEHHVRWRWERLGG